VRVIAFDQLAEKGVRYSRTHLRRRIREGSFPAPVQLGKHRIGWHENVIDAWLKDRPTVGTDGGAPAT
jgi:prophage regulatory protein